MNTSKQGSEALDASVGAFTENLFDYAGLFPPAKLALEKAVGEYHAIQQGEHKRMVSSFVCPITKLRELSASPKSPEMLSIVPAMPDQWDWQLLSESYLRDQKEIDGTLSGVFENRIKGLELKLSEGLVHSLQERGGISGFVIALASFNAILEKGIPAYVEIIYEDGQRTAEEWHEGVVKLVVVLAELANERGLQFGLKLRCGGLRAQDVPSAEQVAFVIEQCKMAKLPLKVTAGLHHAVCSHTSTEDVKEHGFLNVIGAALLAHNLDIERGELVSVVRDPNASHFDFVSGSFRWKEHQVSHEQIAASRASFIRSIGTCSFAEPRDELLQLGFLPSSS